MSLNDTPVANRVHISFFGRRNVGKSSLVNAVTGQELSVVSDVKGTTTDPVQKTMELLPMGPVLIIDTPGIDDSGPLGELRVKRTRQVLNKTDVAVLVTEAGKEPGPAENDLLRLFKDKGIPFLIACNKCDLVGDSGCQEGTVPVSALSGAGVHELKERIAALSRSDLPEKHIVADLLAPGDVAVLVTPIDSAAPKGRLILPQQQTIRDILDCGAISVVVQEDGLKTALASLGRPPALVITDSQAFERVAEDTPEEIPLTSFSILFARYKGLLEAAADGVKALDTLRDGDRVLICEGCTHHRQCDDIGTVKLPRWLRAHTGAEPQFEFTSGAGFPEDLAPYRLIVHCGGCMLGEREVGYRQKCALDQGVPITNYGILIASMKGILRRSVAVFPQMRGRM